MENTQKQNSLIYIIIIMLGIIIGFLYQTNIVLKESYNDQHWMTGMMEQIYDKMK